jgi:SH3-like domain-containing protein
MRHRSIIAIVTILAAGGVGLALIPGQAKPEIANIDAASSAPTGIGAAAPSLLRTLDYELSPPTVAPATPPTKVAAVEPAPIAPAASLAAPAPPISDTPLSDDRIGPTAVNMRSGPSTSSDTLSVLTPDQPVQVGETRNGWVQVTLPDGTGGWVYGTYLARAAVAAPATENSAAPPARTTTAQARAVIRGSAGDLEDRMAHIASPLTAYSRPLDSARSVFTLQPGDEVRIAEVRGDWLRVETDDGMMAWIRRAR